MQQYLLSNISYLLSIICGRSRDRNGCRSDRSGFTMIEMVAVILILTLLIAVLVPSLSRARLGAWRVQAREACRELCGAWGAYLLDVRSFEAVPESFGSKDGTKATSDNLKEIATGKGESPKIYIELNDTEREADDETGGLRDHWGQLLLFSLDKDYDGKVDNPYPAANGLTDAKVKGSAIAWSLGHPKYDKRADRKIVIWE